MKENFEVLVPPQKEHLALVRQLVKQVVLYEYPALTPRLEELQLCVSEAVANSISAHNKVECLEPISVKVILFGDHIEVQVQDRGEGFDLGELSEPNSEIYDRETGWGLEIMKDQADFIEISPSNEGTFVRMGIYPQK